MGGVRTRAGAALPGAGVTVGGAVGGVTGGAGASVGAGVGAAPSAAANDTLSIRSSEWKSL